MSQNLMITRLGIAGTAAFVLIVVAGSIPFAMENRDKTKVQISIVETCAKAADPVKCGQQLSEAINKVK
ncbi:MAG TPA: hypothetical protein VF575_00660 [Candidatus Saccharimonadales bacterium]|jgi:hypothetical protein